MALTVACVSDHQSGSSQYVREGPCPCPNYPARPGPVYDSFSRSSQAFGAPFLSDDIPTLARNPRRESCCGDGQSVRELVPAEPLRREAPPRPQLLRHPGQSPGTRRCSGSAVPWPQRHSRTRRRRRSLPSRTRNSTAHQREAIDIGPEVLWMQLGIVNEETAAPRPQRPNWR